MGLSLAEELNRRDQTDVELVFGQLVRKVARQIEAKPAPFGQATTQKFDEGLRIEVRYRSKPVFLGICHDFNQERVATGAK